MESRRDCSLVAVLLKSVLELDAFEVEEREAVVREDMSNIRMAWQSRDGMESCLAACRGRESGRGY